MSAKPFLEVGVDTDRGVVVLVVRVFMNVHWSVFRDDDVTNTFAE